MYMKTVIFSIVVTCLMCSVVPSISTFPVELNSREIFNVTAIDISEVEALPNTVYTYHSNYSSLLTDLQFLNTSYSQYVELYSLNNRYAYPKTVYGYDIWCLRITNESLGFNKPEVLFIGAHHGNEIVSVECAYWYAYWLLVEQSSNPQVQYLLNNREIYIIPCLNPDGRYHSTPSRTNGNGEDINRDYDYDYSSSESSGTAFSEVESKCVRDLVEEHQFILSITWHAGTEMIIYSRGDYNHSTEGPDNSPDDLAFFGTASIIRVEAGKAGHLYPAGIANDVLYPCYGAYEDWAYASRVEYGDTLTDDDDGYAGAGILSHCVEASNAQGDLSESLLGSSTTNGYVSANIRLAFATTDLAYPYIGWKSTNNSISSPGEAITLTWQVNGSRKVDNTDLWCKTPANPSAYQRWNTQSFSGDSGWAGTNYQQQIAFPTTHNDTYYFKVRAQVDGETNSSSAMSRYVRSRNWSSWYEAGNQSDNTQWLNGETDFWSPILAISVIGETVTEGSDPIIWIIGISIIIVCSIVVIRKKGVI